MSIVASRYAKSLLELAQEEKVLNTIYTDMVLIYNTISNNYDLSLLLKSPIVNTDKKQNILNSIFNKDISELSSRFLGLITSKKREYLVIEIASSFINQYKKINNIIVAQLTSSVSLEDKQKVNIISLNLASVKNTSFSHIFLPIAILVIT